MMKIRYCGIVGLCSFRKAEIRVRFPAVAL